MNDSEPLRIGVDKLSKFVIEVLGTLGVSEEDSTVVADCLLTANLSGVDSHGVVRLAHYLRRLENGTIQTKPTIRFEKSAPSLGIMDGGNGLGHVITQQATTHAMEMAAETGSGMVSIRNSSHFGMAGFYILRLVSAGYIGMCMTATDRFIVPFGARKPFFGTNPIAFGFPGNDIPVVLDMATSAIPYGKIALAKVEGQPIPADWAVDDDGNPTTDPASAVGMHPVAGPKGSGLAMVIDVFSSVLAGLPWGPHINRMYAEMDAPRELGHFIMALNVEKLLPLELFKHSLGNMLKELTALEPAEGFERVYFPGELEGLRRKQRRDEGIPIDAGLRKELSGIGEKYNVEFPR